MPSPSNSALLQSSIYLCVTSQDLKLGQLPFPIDETSYKSHNMIFICTDEGEWSVKVNIVNEIAYFCVYCCLKIGKTIPIYSENNITQSIREIIKKKRETILFQWMWKNIIDQTPQCTTAKYFQEKWIFLQILQRE